MLISCCTGTSLKRGITCLSCRWEESESSRNPENEESVDDPSQHIPEEEHEDESVLEEDPSQAKASEDESGSVLNLVLIGQSVSTG